jgi:hypothetical protein
MTTRTLLGRRARWLFGLLLVAIAILFAVTIIGVMKGVNVRRSPWCWASTIPLWIGFVAGYAFLRCPRCRGSLRMLAFGWMRADRTALCCPYCGLGFDEELTPMKLVESAARHSSPQTPVNRPQGAGITARMLHRRRNRWIWGTYLAGVTTLLVCLGLLIVFKNAHPLRNSIVIVVFALMGSAVVMSGAGIELALGFRCPRCRVRILLRRFWWPSWDTTISCCPYCGFDWDEELSDEAPTPK